MIEVTELPAIFALVFGVLAVVLYGWSVRYYRTEPWRYGALGIGVAMVLIAFLMGGLSMDVMVFLDDLQTTGSLATPEAVRTASELKGFSTLLAIGFPLVVGGFGVTTIDRWIFSERPDPISNPGHR